MALFGFPTHVVPPNSGGSSLAGPPITINGQHGHRELDIILSQVYHQYIQPLHAQLHQVSSNMTDLSKQVSDTQASLSDSFQQARAVRELIDLLNDKHSLTTDKVDELI